LPLIADLIGSIIGFLALPVGVLFFVWVIGNQFGLWEKWLPKITNRLGHREMPNMSKALNSMKFDGIGKLFRK